jgi:hypothetical protein
MTRRRLQSKLLLKFTRGCQKISLENKTVYNKTTIFGTSSGLINCLAYTPGEQSTNWATPTVRTAGATPGRCVCLPGTMSGTMWARVLPPRVPEADVLASTQESDWKLLGLTQCDVMDRSW